MSDLGKDPSAKLAAIVIVSVVALIFLPVYAVNMVKSQQTPYCQLKMNKNSEGEVLRQDCTPLNDELICLFIIKFDDKITDSVQSTAPPPTSLHSPPQKLSI